MIDKNVTKYSLNSTLRKDLKGASKGVHNHNIHASQASK